MSDLANIIRQELNRTGGVLRLRPAYARRLYRDGGRLGGRGTKPGATWIRREKLYVPERWIASTSVAVNPFPRAKEGLSVVNIPGAEFTLRDALAACPDLLLGAEYAAAHDNEFRVLAKILDGYEPIPFHVHASDSDSDSDLKRHPRWFKGHRFGKTEAYYFLEAPKGAYPYTHVGLHEGVNAKHLLAAIWKGRDFVIDLSPVFHQRYATGFFMPAGLPHSPGTALTLEIQQPSDVCTLLEKRPVFGVDDFTPHQQHPGIPNLERALQLIDFKEATRRDVIEKHQITPELIRRNKGAEEHWIYPPRFTAEFSGKRLRIASGRSFECRERGPYAVFVWRGQGRVTRHEFRARRGQDEFLVSNALALSAHRYESTGDGPLELFKIFPQHVNSGRISQNVAS